VEADEDVAGWFLFENERPMMIGFPFFVPTFIPALFPPGT
jgi:hypothetical protein